MEWGTAVEGATIVTAVTTAAVIAGRAIVRGVGSLIKGFKRNFLRPSMREEVGGVGRGEANAGATTGVEVAHFKVKTDKSEHRRGTRGGKS